VKRFDRSFLGVEKGALAIAQNERFGKKKGLLAFAILAAEHNELLPQF